MGFTVRQLETTLCNVAIFNKFDKHCFEVSRYFVFDRTLEVVFVLCRLKLFSFLYFFRQLLNTKLLASEYSLQSVKVNIQTLYNLIDSSIWFYTINLEWYIICIEGSQVIISEKKIFV